MTSKPKSKNESWAALKNYRTWVMVLTYGYCFGVELTVRACVCLGLQLPIAAAANFH